MTELEEFKEILEKHYVPMPDAEEVGDAYMVAWIQGYIDCVKTVKGMIEEALEHVH